MSLQTDGDLMYAPGGLWTAAHHRIPLLSVMLNNRGYHQELMHVQRMCNERNRGVDRGTLGSMLTDPNIDFAKIAQGLGLHAEGPISDLKDLGPAIRRSAAAVGAENPHWSMWSRSRGKAFIFSLAAKAPRVLVEGADRQRSA